MNKASFFFQNKFKVDGKFIHFVVVYLFGLCFILFFFMKKMQIMCNWCCPCEEKMFCFYSLLVMYIHCGLLKEYTAYSIFKIPLLIIFKLVLNHWFKFFFLLKTIPMSFWCSFFKLKQKTYLFKLFFILEIYSQSYFFRDMTFNFEQCCDLDLSFTFHSIWSCPL